MTSDCPVHVTDQAARRFVWLLERDHAQGMHLYLKKGGCSGYEYVLETCSAPPEGAKSYPLSIEGGPIAFWISEKHEPLLSGIEIDFSVSRLEKKFIFRNPHQKGQCGCGESVAF